MRRLLAPMMVLLLGVPAQAATTAAPVPRHYPSPDAAASALVEAVRTPTPGSLHDVLGTGAEILVSSGDPVQDAAELRHFLELYDAAHRLAPQPDGSVILDIGPDDWPLPFPIRRNGDATWQFDAAAGAQQIVDRRIGRNEIAALQTLLALVDAQADFADRAEKAGQRHYAAHIVSGGTGLEDGLYWPTRDDEPDSPLGPLARAAIAEGYPDSPRQGQLVPYRGYVFRLLTGQGPHAPGGARPYVRGGRLTDGFGVIACPANYGGGGYTSFVVDQDGVVFQKDLGEPAAERCAAIRIFDPDLSWARVDIADN